MKTIISAMALILTMQAQACYNDYDCSSGARCVKSFGNYAGAGSCMSPSVAHTDVDTSIYSMSNQTNPADDLNRAQMNAMQAQKMRIELQQMQNGQ